VRVHVHVWVHVASHDWQGRPTMVCKCACGETLTPEQIVAMRTAAGVAP
jgi:hypothetical protein